MRIEWRIYFIFFFFLLLLACQSERICWRDFRRFFFCSQKAPGRGFAPVRSCQRLCVAHSCASVRKRSRGRWMRALFFVSHGRLGKKNEQHLHIPPAFHRISSRHSSKATPCRWCGVRKAARRGSASFRSCISASNVVVVVRWRSCFSCARSQRRSVVHAR